MAEDHEYAHTGTVTDLHKRIELASVTSEKRAKIQEGRPSNDTTSAIKDSSTDWVIFEKILTFY